MTKLLHEELTHAIIGTYYDVYNGTGRTYPEFIYERAMVHDLRHRGITCRQQEEYQVFYKDKLVGSQHLDLFVASEVVVEIKVAPELIDLHRAQAFSYLKVADREVGLLCNFGSEKPQFERLYFRPRPVQEGSGTDGNMKLKQLDEWISPELSGTVIGGLFQVHTRLGPGFVHRIYANATHHELSLLGLDVLPQREYQVIYRGQSIGEIKFNHLRVENQLMLFPVAVRDIDSLSINNLKAWMKVQEVPVGIVANFYPSKLDFTVLRTS
jgi:GxxExxY protein